MQETWLLMITFARRGDDVTTRATALPGRYRIAAVAGLAVAGALALGGAGTLAGRAGVAGVAGVAALSGGGAAGGTAAGGTAAGGTAAGGTAAAPQIVAKPVSMTTSPGQFTLGAGTRIVGAGGSGGSAVAQGLGRYV